MDVCRHSFVTTEGDDESLLLDDENTSRKCTQCNKTMYGRDGGIDNGLTLGDARVRDGFVVDSRLSSLFGEEPFSGVFSETYPGESSWRRNERASGTGTGTGIGTGRGAPNGRINSRGEDGIDSPEDSPLLLNSHLSEFGNLTIDEFHCHAHHKPTDSSIAVKKLIAASVLCLLFMITELIGGYVAGSLAVMTDAAHLFSDLIGFLVSILSIRIGKWMPTQKMTFGFRRAEVLGAFISVLAVWLLAGIFCILAINRLVKREYEIDEDTMMLVASLGVVVNILMGGILHGVFHTHSHGLIQHSHSHSHEENINVRAAAAHVLGDLLQSIGVLVAAIVIKIFPGAKMADPICTLLFSIVVVWATVKVARDSLLILLEASPRHLKEISSAFRSLPGVKHVHSVHMWSLAPGKDAIAAHLAVDDYCDRDIILHQATHIVRSRLSTVSCTIQIESFNEQLIDNCKDCQLLQC